MAARQDWQDCAKGIGIVLVVLGHVLRGLETSGILVPGMALKFFDYGMYLFHMPLFFFLSGLNVERSLARGMQPFLLERAWTIAYPYFLWSIIQGLVRVNLANDVNIPVGYDHLLTIFWSPVSQFWFLYALMLCHLCVAIFGLSRAVMAGLAIAGWLASSYAPYPLEKFCYNLPFYLAGIGFSAWLSRAMESRQRCAAFILPASVGFVAAAALNAALFGLKYEIPPAIVSGFAGIAVTLAVSGALSGAARKIAAWLGRLSMTIYILHILAGAGTRIALAKLGIGDATLHVFAGTTAGVLLPVAAHYVFAKFGLLVALGLQALPRKRAVASAPLSVTSQS